jgi:hypothetical protein
MVHITGENPAWEAFLVAASVPLRLIGPERTVLRSASGVLVWWRGRLLLITAGHIRRNRGDWVAEVRYDETRNETEVFVLSKLHMVKRITRVGAQWVDLAFMLMPSSFRPKIQAITGILGHGRVDDEEERPIFASDLRAIPKVGRRYGFAGQVETDAVDHFVGKQFIAGETQIETHIRYEKEAYRRYVFKLEHPHLGHDRYRGCSGAPICDKYGTLVSILLRGSIAKDQLYGLPLARYRGLIRAVVAGAT